MLSRSFHLGLDIGVPHFLLLLLLFFFRDQAPFLFDELLLFLDLLGNGGELFVELIYSRPLFLLFSFTLSISLPTLFLLFLLLVGVVVLLLLCFDLRLEFSLLFLQFFEAFTQLGKLDILQVMKVVLLIRPGFWAR